MVDRDQDLGFIDEQGELDLVGRAIDRRRADRRRSVARKGEPRWQRVEAELLVRGVEIAQVDISTAVICRGWLPRVVRVVRGRGGQRELRCSRLCLDWRNEPQRKAHGASQLDHPGCEQSRADGGCLAGVLQRGFGRHIECRDKALRRQRRSVYRPVQLNEAPKSRDVARARERNGICASGGVETYVDARDAQGREIREAVEGIRNRDGRRIERQPSGRLIPQEEIELAALRNKAEGLHLGRRAVAVGNRVDTEHHGRVLQR